MKESNRSLIIAIKYVCLITILFLSAFQFVSFDSLKSLLNSLASDGNVESFHQMQFVILKTITSIIAIVSAFLFLSLHFYLGKSIIIYHRFLLQSKNAAKKFFEDTKTYFVLMRNNLPSKKESVVIGLIVFIAAILRLQLISRPLEYDEAYTYNEFARHSLNYILSEYYVVNNHIFHTILVKISTAIFGPQPWAIRMPVFLSGLLIVFVGYQLAKKAFNNKTIGLISAFLLAILPILIDKSVSARAYTLIALFFLIGINIAYDVIRKNNSFAWALLCIITALGVFSNPIMLYPFIIIFLWLAICGFFKLFGSEYKNMMHWLIKICVWAMVSGLISIVFYSQIFRHYGILTVFNGNQVVDPLPYSKFFAQLPQFILFIYQDWKIGIPKIIFFIILIVYFASFLFKNYQLKELILFLVFPLLTISFILLQRPTNIARVWLWMVPFLLIGSAAGIYFIYDALNNPVHRIIYKSLAVLMLGLLFFFSIKFVYPVPYQREDDSPIVITELLEETITTDDVVVLSMSADARYWYYFNLYGLPENTIRGIKQRPFSRAFIIVYPSDEEDYETVLSDFAPDRVFLDRSTEELIFEYRGVEVYEINANDIAIQDQFSK
jgi:hypothetical protein